jgi:L-alanine-DL-glutamate epimerase-like enolase superfamily enzyme
MQLVWSEFALREGVLELPKKPGLGGQLNEEVVRQLSATANTAVGV